MSWLPVVETTGDGHQKTAFGDTAVSISTPVARAYSAYGILDELLAGSGLGGSATEVDGKFVVTTGVSLGGFGSLTIKESIIFRPGQGEKAIFTAAFSQGVAGTEAFAGLLNPNDGVGIGIDPTTGEFAVLIRRNGSAVIQELQITTPAGGAENATITINGTPYIVPLTAGTVQQNAVQIEQSLSAQVPLYFFQAVDDTVIVNSQVSAPATGGFSFTSATAVGVFTEVAAGVLPTDKWIMPSDLSVGLPAGFDYNALNSYMIQYGPDVAFFWVLDARSNRFELFHVENSNNDGITSLSKNPTFSFSWYAFNRAASGNVTITGTFAGIYREGENTVTREGRTAQNTKLGVSSTTPVPLVTIRSRISVGDVINQSKIAIDRVRVVASGNNKAVTASLYKNATLTGQVFQYVDETLSFVEVDTSATSVTGTPITTTALNELDFGEIDISLRRGESVTIAANITSGTAADFVGTIRYIEDA